MTLRPPLVLVAAVVAGVLLLFVVAPIAVVVVGSVVNSRWLGVSSEQWVPGSDGLLTFQWFGYVLATYGRTMLFSLELALGSVAICLLLGAPAAYALVRCPFPGSRVVEEILLVPLSIPGITLSIALIQTYAAFRGRAELVLAGHLLYTIPFMVRTTTHALRSFDVASLERAAQTLGAGLARRWFLVVLPNLRHALLVGSLLVFAISWGEFNVSYLLNTPLHQTFPAALYATFTFNSFQVASAATTLFLLVVLPLLLALEWVGGRETERVEQGA